MENQKKDSTSRDDQRKKEANSTTAKQEETLVNSALVSMETREDTGAGKECVLAIVPVPVKLAKSDKTVTTYAFLDPGSSATFFTQKLVKQSHVKGKKTDILLRAMGQETPVSSYEVTGLH